MERNDAFGTIDPIGAAFRAALECGDLDAIRKVPKADLHTHAFLGGRLSRYRAWAGLDLPDPPELFEDFSDFDKYILVDLAVPYLNLDLRRTRDFFAFFFAETIREAITDGVVVIEPSIDVTTVDLFAGDSGAMVDFFSRLIPENAHIEVRPELGMPRGIPLEYIEAKVPSLLKTGFFRSVDLYGDERVGGVAEYAGIWRKAGELGLRKKAHAGELCSAGRVKESVVTLDLDAVQHGIAAAESPALMDFLARRGTTLNVCPTSNVRLARAESIETHPVRKLFDAGVRVTINSDDLMVFDSSVSEEFLKLKKASVFTAEELDRIRLNGL